MSSPAPAIGAGSRRPLIILIHGWSGRKSDWAIVEEQLRGLALKTRCLNIPGHSQPADLESEIPSWEELIQRWVQELEQEKAPVALIGYSMGGRLALALSARLGDKVLGLGLLSAGLGFANAQEREARQLLDTSRARKLVADPATFWQDWYAQALFRGSRSQIPWDAAAAKAGQCSESLAKALVHYGPGVHPHLAPFVKSAKNVLYLFGELDTSYAAVALEIAKLNPNAQIAALKGAGHALLQECPADCGENLERWLAALIKGSEVRNEEWTCS